MPSGVYKRKPFTPEHCAILSKAHDGVPLSQEHRKAMSEASKGVPKSPEHCAAMSKAHTGIPHSPERIAVISKGQEEAGMYEVMRGGDDICSHHYIYDHANPELYTMKVTRSKHQQIHMWMKKAGIKVPHINEDAGEWRCNQ